MISKKILAPVMLFVVFNISFAQNNRMSNDEAGGILHKMAVIADWGMETLTFEKEKYTFFAFPLMSYEDRTQLEFGIMPVWRFYLGGNEKSNAYYRPSNIAPSVMYSTSGMYEFKFASNFFTKNNWHIRNRWLYQWMPDKFYSIGNFANKDVYSDIELKKLEFTGKVMKGITEKVFLGINYDVGVLDVKDVGIGLLNNGVEGYEGGNIIGFGPIVSHDTRNNIVYPNKGSYISFDYTYYPKSIGDFSFSSLTFDARKFFDLGKKERVLATQIYLKSADGDVPFFRLPVLGGKRFFRGVSHPYKYMDKNMLYLQAAYRSHLVWRFGYEVFTGAGNIFNKWNSTLFEDVHVMAGLGLRIRVIEKEKLNFRFDYGLATNGDSGFFFTLGEAF
ncbi:MULTISPECIES: hypothetical protein [unclassified Saccharicrinis]|uniref:hypothetical protein n=1 Tax=unclassified Saccharicrinis TaxID=2646859 RepID=UPI003D32B7DB